MDHFRHRNKYCRIFTKSIISFTISILEVYLALLFELFKGWRVMKLRNFCCAIVSLFVMTICNTSFAHGGWGGGHHHGWGYGSSVYIGGIGMGYGYGPYGYGYGPYGYPYYAYPPTVVAVPTSPPVYIQQQPAASTVTQQHPAGYWYYCNKPSGYYPYIKECPAGWQQVSPTPSDNH